MTSESFDQHDSGPRTAENKTRHTRIGSLDCTTVVSLTLLPSPREEAPHRLGTQEVGRPDAIPVAACIPSSEDHGSWRGEVKIR